MKRQAGIMERQLAKAAADKAAAESKEAKRHGRWLPAKTVCLGQLMHARAGEAVPLPAADLCC